MSILELEWQGASFDSVGIDNNTISNMILYLAFINSKFPDSHKKTADEIAVKMLQCLNPPRQSMATLGTMALVELKKAERFFINGHRSAEAACVTSGSRSDVPTSLRALLARAGNKVTVLSTPASA